MRSGTGVYRLEDLDTTGGRLPELLAAEGREVDRIVETTEHSRRTTAVPHDDDVRRHAADLGEERNGPVVAMLEEPGQAGVSAEVHGLVSRGKGEGASRDAPRRRSRQVAAR